MSDATKGAGQPGPMTSASSSGLQTPMAEQHTYHCSCAWSCEDDPPPYASLVDPSPEHHHHQQQQRLPWSYVFQRCETDNRTIARPLVAIPLTSYGIFKIEPPSYTAATAQAPRQQSRIVPELGPVVKSSSGSSRKYSAILIAATVIIFLMALSLMVRLVTEKSFWRG
ncbi:uncharacterized protein LOC106638235 [Copidosoma floridanum]|uniref:uncharacterized protein LOC106638235 n=1 Tax=Copidosoma floridanum TaxID=29053 RepID=UPI0006C9DDAF|nr:uncharacterized protein LOC106638235 [Copidosoma floridanum]